MGFFELFIIAIGLSMDAFAVSVCKGLSARRFRISSALACGLYFGGFQALMPALGYVLGVRFQSIITSVDHWIAFVLLGLIGMKMVHESRDTSAARLDASCAPALMLPLAIATSIDALAVGVTFAFLQVQILQAVLLIGVTTFAFSAIGVGVGSVFGEKYKSRAELFGGVVLILMGAKILIEHLFF